MSAGKDPLVVQDDFIKGLYNDEKTLDPNLDTVVTLFLASDYPFMEAPTLPHIRWWWYWMWNACRVAIDRNNLNIYA